MKERGWGVFRLLGLGCVVFCLTFWEIGIERLKD